jgi:N-acyl-D-aspartate/D-glutamate deacylase
MSHDVTMIGLGDGGAHCSVICDASNPTYLVSHWARNRVRGEKLPLEWLVHQQTGRPATYFGFHDRRTLVPGKRADINIIDMDALTPRKPEIVYDLPTGGRRFIQRAGQPTGALPGTLLRCVDSIK